MLGHILAETELHVRLCAEWGISASQLASEKEHAATIAYTRFVLDCGASGDLLDLMVSLAPCVIGYAEIGRRLAPDGVGNLDGHPYKDWVSQYSDDSYQQTAEGAKAHLNELAEKHLTEARFEEVALIFAKATQLEADFWQMSLDENAL